MQTEFPSVYTFDEVRDILRMIRRHTCAVIVCEGAASSSVRLCVTNAVSVYTGLGSDNIEVIKMN